MPPQDQNKTGAGHIDLDKVLLPKKNAPSVDSAQRINAGALFEQEQNATLRPEAPEPAAAPAPQAPKPEQPLVRPLQTYQSDIESLVTDKSVSVVSIAAAEADRRANLPPQALEAEEIAAREGRPWTYRALVIGGSVLLLAAAGGIGFYIYAALQPVPIAQQSPAPFISVDDTQTITITSNDGRSSIMQMLVAARDQAALAVGLVERLQITKPTAANDGTLQEVGAPEFLQEFAPKAPPELVRTLEPQMLLGVHSYDENAPFLILKVDSYETAYSAMLAWESTMQADLLPLFRRTPPVHPRPPVPTTPIAPAPIMTTASTALAASTTPAASSTQTTASTTAPAAAAPGFFGGNFVDQVVDNHDARAILNQQGDILLLWTFLDRSTIVITTNEATLREVISRLSQASVVSLPAAGQ